MNRFSLPLSSTYSNIWHVPIIFFQSYDNLLELGNNSFIFNFIDKLIPMKWAYAVQRMSNSKWNSLTVYNINYNSIISNISYFITICAQVHRMFLYQNKKEEFLLLNQITLKCIYKCFISKKKKKSIIVFVRCWNILSFFFFHYPAILSFIYRLDSSNSLLV